MTVALKGSHPETPMLVEVEEKDGEVRLIYNKFAFVVCRTVGKEHVVEVRDIDTGVRHTAPIASSCWRR
jgi:hypothetical protein